MTEVWVKRYKDPQRIPAYHLERLGTLPEWDVLSDSDDMVGLLWLFAVDSKEEHNDPKYGAFLNVRGAAKEWLEHRECKGTLERLAVARLLSELAAIAAQEPKTEREKLDLEASEGTERARLMLRPDPGTGGPDDSSIADAYDQIMRDWLDGGGREKLKGIAKLKPKADGQ
jgi:hypothetical protein